MLLLMVSSLSKLHIFAMMMYRCQLLPGRGVDTRSPLSHVPRIGCKETHVSLLDNPKYSGRAVQVTGKMWPTWVYITDTSAKRHVQQHIDSMTMILPCASYKYSGTDAANL